MDFWGILTGLWNDGLNLLSFEVVLGDVSFTLWQYALGSAVFLLVMWTVMRIISGD